MEIGGVAVLAAVVIAAAGFVALSYWRTRGDRDPGLTTEVALVATVLTGALAMHAPGPAAAVGVTIAILLAGRTPIHRFVDRVLTEREVDAALLLGAASLIVLPMLPDQAMGPFNAINPRTVWMLVILVLSIGAAGHVAVRMLGVKYGLPAAGFASGFISSAATIAAMGSRAAKAPHLLAAASAGAVLSTIATIAQLGIVTDAVSPETLAALRTPLLAAGAAAVLYGVTFTLIGLRHAPEESATPGEAVSLKAALMFGALLAAVLLAAAALKAWLGGPGVMAAAALAGLVDTHAAAIATAALVANDGLSPHDAALAILAGFTTNTATKIGLAIAGGRAFALRVVPGLVLVLAAAWAGALLG